jgi:hypothetical protein
MMYAVDFIMVRFSYFAWNLFTSVSWDFFIVIKLQCEVGV